MSRHATLAALVLCSVCLPNTIRTDATLFEKDSGRSVVLFRFSETRTIVGDRITAEARYTDPEGNEVVRETFLHENGSLRRFESAKLQTGELAVVEYRDGKIHYFYRDRKGKESTRAEDRKPETVSQDELSPYIRAHWDTLVSGESLKIRYVVPQRKETIGFRLSAERRTQCQGRPALVLKMKPSSFFIALVVKPIYLTYYVDGEKEACEIVGRTTPYRNKNGKFEDLDAHTVFTPRRRSIPSPSK